MRKLLFLKSLNSTLKQKFENRYYVVNDNDGKYFGHYYWNVTVGLAFKFENGKLKTYWRTKNDVAVVHKDSRDIEFKIVRRHEMDLGVPKVRKGDVVKKGQVIAIEDGFPVQSRLSGVVESVSHKNVTVVREYNWKIPGTKIVLPSAMKATTDFANNIEILECEDEVIELFRARGWNIERGEEVPDVILDFKSAQKRGFEELLKEKKIVKLRIDDDVVYCVVVKSRVFIGEQIDDYELKIPFGIDERFGHGKNAPRIDMFTYTILKAKFPEAAREVRKYVKFNDPKPIDQFVNQYIAAYYRSKRSRK